MEIEIKSSCCAVPCLITADADNRKYMIRKEDTNCEVFNSLKDLKQSIDENWSKEMFED
ncbi:hypothetical protein [Metabacillus idriensis]|uniref:hypothetical protein n=1 Tax=Metabacillus idriensis TaxID=324768 RepID=UPI00163A5211|nr:hypothetical protein [Metabacillus idriensis]QNG61559.1 hypothetical protein H4O14_08820 [Bacillus sp. PAMC26568]